MQKVTNCRVCGSSEFAPDRRATIHLNLEEPFMVMRCNGCAFRWLDPQLSEQEYDEVYRGGYFGIEEADSPSELERVLRVYPSPEGMWQRVQDTRIRSFQRKLDRIRGLQGAIQHILDVGAGTGAFVREAEIKGFEVVGLETSQAACEEAKASFGTTLQHGRLSQFSSDIQFDLLHLNHVFEHLVDPQQGMIDFKRLLRPGGYVMIEVPNQFENGIERLKRMLGLTETIPRSLHSIHHPYFYTPETLQKVLRSGGFEVVSLQTFFPERWSGSLQRKFLALCDFLAAFFADAGRDFEIIAKLHESDPASS